MNHRPDDHEDRDDQTDEKADSSGWLTYWIYSVNLSNVKKIKLMLKFTNQ